MTTLSTPWPIAAFVLLLFFAGSLPFELVSPISHISLTGDIEVLVTSKAEVNWSELALAIRLVAVDAEMATLTSAPVIERKAVFRCGAIDVAGRFCFQLIDLSKLASPGDVDDADDDAVLVESRLMDVKWPHVRIEVPDMMETYTADISARIHVQGVVCYPPRPRLRTWLELAFYGASMARGPLHSRYLQEFPDFYQVLSLDITLRCNLLDQPGFYQVVLRSDRGTPVLIGASTAMRVVWSDAYWLHAAPPTVFPCASVVAVSIRHPRCILSDDKVRLFGRPPLNVSAWVEGDRLEYVAEERIIAGEGRLLFPCPTFPPHYETFCFKYVSTARSGAVADLRLHCIPAYAFQGVSLNGNWGEWSPWTSCSNTCGQGTRNRYRFCDSPPPSRGRAFCTGSAIKVETCQKSVCPMSPTTVSPVLLVPVSDSCRCGCKMNVSGSAVVSSSRLHCNTSAVWILQVREGHRLEVIFNYVRLEVEKEWVVARNGHFLSSPMVAFVTGENPPSASARSSRHLMLLEFHPATDNFFDRSLPTGFIAQVQEITEKGLSVFMVTPWTRSGFTGSPAHWTALTLCLVALTSAVVLAVLHALRRGRWRKTIGRSRQDSGRSTPNPAGYEPCLHPLTTTTSISDISLTRLYTQQRKRKKKRKRKFLSRKKPLSPVSSDGGNNTYVRVKESPEDVMQDAATHLWEGRTDSRRGERKKKTAHALEDVKVDLSPASPSLKSPPLGRRPTRQVALDPSATRRLPIATVSPQPQRPPMDKQSPPLEDKSKEHVRNEDKRSKHVRPSRGPKRKSHLNSDLEGGMSSPALVGSASEMSFAGTDIAPDLEYDYYDYDVHDEPGSFFCADSGVLSWLPPFLPQPPQWDEPMMPLAEFSAALGIMPPPEAKRRMSENQPEINGVIETAVVIQHPKRSDSEHTQNVSSHSKSSPSLVSPVELETIEFADASDPDSPKKQTLKRTTSEEVRR